MVHVSQAKKDVVDRYVDLINKYDVIGAVNMENLPAKQLQAMREQLRGHVELVMAKRRVIKVALEKSGKEGLTDLGPHLKGMPALLFSNESPFKLFKTLKKNKSSTAIKAGQKAPHDILVPAGKTSFAPGPIIGELGSVGIAAGIDGGKVVIKKDSIVAKEGTEITPSLAGILARLGIEPMEIGLDLTAVYENGELLLKSILDVDEEQYLNDLTAMAQQAFNLAVNIAYPNKETINVLVANAFSDSRSLALSQDILTDLTAGDTLAKAYRQMLSLASKLSDDALSDELKSASQAVSAVAQVSSSEESVKEDKKEEKEEQNESSAAAGMANLFG